MKYPIATTFLLIFFQIGLKAQIATIPFELDHDHILIDIKDKDGTKRKFVFDTGAESTVFDMTLAKEIGLKADGEIDVTGAGGSKSLEYVLNQSLYLTNDLIIKKVPFILSDLSAFDWQFDGIIGNDLLKKYIVKIDYIQQELAIFKKLKKDQLTGFTTVPFKFNNDTRIPQFNISLVLDNDETLEGSVLFDTGAGLTLLVGKPFATENDLLNRIGKTLSTSGVGLNVESQHKLARVKSIQLDTFSLGAMVIQISSTNSGVFSTGNYLGLMGNVISSKFDVVINYKKQELYFKPNQTFTDPFDFQVSGMKLKKKDKEIIVSSIIVESQVYDQGIRKGDRIVSINGDKSGDLRAYRESLKKEGEQVAIDFIKKGEDQVQKITLTLERLL